MKSSVNPVPEAELPMKQFQLPNGLRVWNAPDSGRETRFIYHEIFVRHEYEKHGVAVSPGDVVFDVGANIGLFTLSLMQRFRNLRIYCFEPVPAIHACLTRNLNDSPWRWDHKLCVLNSGLSSFDGELVMNYFPAVPGNSTVYPDSKLRESAAIFSHLRFADYWRFGKWKALVHWPLRRVFSRSVEKALSAGIAIPCQFRTLSGIIRQCGVHQIDLLKIDVEGAEFDVLDGIEACHWQLIRQISMEIAPAKKPRVRALLENLRFLGFSSVSLECMFGGEANLSDPLPCMVYAVRKGN